MNAFQRFAVRLAAWFVPSLRRLLSTAGGTVERLSEQVTLLRARESDRRSRIEIEKAELLEAFAMAGGGPWLRGSDIRAAGSGLSESAAVPAALKERLADLELALEDRGWQRQVAASQWEFSRWGIQQIILISRLYFIKNPLIRRGVQVSSYYVFGRGVEISSDDKTADGVLRSFFSDPRNQTELSHTGLVQKEESLHTDGNLFFAFFTTADGGETVLRSIDAIEIEEVVTDPDDGAVPWFFHRRWTQQTFNDKSGVTTPTLADGWYVALGHDPKGLKEIAGKPIMLGDDGLPIPVLQYKVGGLPKWHFGCPLVYCALDWARAYKHFLEDWATITRSLARFSWDVETKGGPGAIAAFKQTLATTLGNSDYQTETNPPPVVGSAFVAGPGNKLTPVRTSGATTEPEQGRRIAHMAYMGFGLPETFFADVSVGTLATATSLDRPTELKFLERQESWREVLQRIGQYVLERSQRAPAGTLREVRKSDPKPKPVQIDITFPAILEGDMQAHIGAIVTAMTLNGGTVSGIDEKTGITLLLTELGVEDVQAVVDAMYPVDTYDMERPPPVEIDPLTGLPPNAPAPVPPGEKPKPKPGKPTEAAVIRAVTELRRALQKLQERQAA